MVSRASLGDGRIIRPAHPRSRNRIHLFLPFFFRPLAFRTCYPWIGSRRLRCTAYRAFFAIRVFLLSLGSALVFFDGVSVGIGITSVSLSVAYSPEDTRNSGMI